MGICKNCHGILDNEIIECSHCHELMHDDCKQYCIRCGAPICDSCSPEHKRLCPECEKIDVYTMEYISSTMFEAFEKCPYLFKNIFLINHGDEIPNKWSRTGQELHNLFDKWSQIAQKDSELMKAEYAEMFSSIDTNLFDDEEDKQKFLQQGYTTIMNWIVEELNRQRPLMTEQKFFTKLHPDLPPVRATIDRINGIKEDVPNWDVEDYKTGKIYTADKLRNNIQLPVYAMTIRENFGALPKRLILRFPLHQAERIYERITDDLYTCQVKRGGTYNISLTETLNRMVEIYKNIRQDRFLPNTKDVHFCENFCPMYKAKTCKTLTTKWQMLMKRGY